MRIVRDYNDTAAEQLEVIAARYIGDFAIRIFFSDGINRLVDFKPFLESSMHPAIQKYLNEDLFMQFEVVDGNVLWNSFDLIFPVADLYSGKVV